MRTPPSSSTTKTPCCTKVGLKRGPWTPEEDDLLSNFITREGEGKWRTLPKRAGLLRCGKSCRLRWMNYLRPSVKRGHISPDEEDLILRLHRLLGNRFQFEILDSISEPQFLGLGFLSKKLISQGIDPRTHKPLSDVQLSSNNNQPPNNNRMIISNYNSDESNGGVVVAAEPVFHINASNELRFAMQPNLDFKGTESPSLEEEDPNYCNDEVFSSFLNSLINEDVFTQPAQSGFGAPDLDQPQSH